MIRNVACLEHWNDDFVAPCGAQHTTATQIDITQIEIGSIGQMLGRMIEIENGIDGTATGEHGIIWIAKFFVAFNWGDLLVLTARFVGREKFYIQTDFRFWVLVWLCRRCAAVAGTTIRRSTFTGLRRRCATITTDRLQIGSFIDNGAGHDRHTFCAVRAVCLPRVGRCAHHRHRSIGQIVSM